MTNSNEIPESMRIEMNRVAKSCADVAALKTMSVKRPSAAGPGFWTYELLSRARAPHWPIYEYGSLKK